MHDLLLFDEKLCEYLNNVSERNKIDKRLHFSLDYSRKFDIIQETSFGKEEISL
jgi:hypothetical protein